jgi:hypothetical protein
MVAMGVRQETGSRGDTRKEVQPVGATIDHNPGFPACDDDAAVANGPVSLERSIPPPMDQAAVMQ